MTDEKSRNEVLEAGLKGGSLAALPGIVSHAIAEHVTEAPKILSRIGGMGATSAASVAGLVASSAWSAHKHNMGAGEVLPLMAGGGGGDYVGGLGGMLAGEKLVNPYLHKIKNPALRFSASIGSTIAGDAVGGAAGNFAGGRVAKLVQDRVSNQQQKLASATPDSIAAVRKTSRR